MAPTPIEAFKLSIQTWEGLYSDDPDDAGNIKRSDGSVVGTMRGVTPVTYAAWKGIPVDEVTPAMMQAITLDEAALIYKVRYYETPGFDQLPWGPCIDVLCDIGWGSGPVKAVKTIQELTGANRDGNLGPQTIGMYKTWLAANGDAKAVEELRKWRIDFYKRLIVIRPANQKYLRGWVNRANWYSTANPRWWNGWSQS